MQLQKLNDKKWFCITETARYRIWNLKDKHSEQFQDVELSKPDNVHRRQ